MPEMTSAPISKWVFILTGAYALLCAPAILLAERYGWPESQFHATQPFAAAICVASGLVFLWKSRGTSSRIRLLAAAAVIVAAAWLAFLVYVVLTLDLGTD